MKKIDITLSADEADSLGKGLIRAARESRDHQFTQVAKLLTTKRSIAIYVNPHLGIKNKK